MREPRFAWPLCWALLACALPAAASAAVVNLTAHGFQVRHELDVASPPAKVYEHLTTQIKHWWNPSHTYTGDSKNLSMDAQPGGCFCEKLPRGGGVEHACVVYAAPGSTLRLIGALGPLQGSGVTGSLTWKLSPVTGGTRLELVYSVGGYMQGGFEQLAGPVDNVLLDQAGRLKASAEK